MYSSNIFRWLPKKGVGMPIDDQTQEITQIAWLYLCCKLGWRNKIGVTGFRFLKGATKKVDCDWNYQKEEYKEDF